MQKLNCGGKLNSIYSNLYINICLDRENGEDWRTLAKSYGYGEAGGLLAVDDDHNPAWEDVEYESDYDYEHEALWQQNDIFNNEFKDPIHKSKNELQGDGQMAFKKYREVSSLFPL